MNTFDMMETAAQALIDDTREDFKITQLTLVNSAKQAWGEIDISNHLAIFGKNNAGKTSLVSALKLALYPENSFTSCESKFNFTHKSGKFTKEQSYDFYFPSYESYIILEVENPNGTFCMVLFKNSGQWQYGRYFVPATYKTVSKLFWDYENSRFNEDILAKSIIRKLKALGGIHPDRLEDISKLIFTGHQGTPEQGRYCIIPLVNGSAPDSIRAFRNLYQLAFDIAQSDQETLPRAVATIIEMHRGRKKEQLNTNFNEVISAHAQLKAEMATITALDNNKSKWDDIDANYDRYLTNRKCLQHDISAALPAIKKELSKLISDRTNAKNEHYSANREHSNLKAVNFKLNEKLGELRGGQVKTRKDHVRAGENYTKACNFKNKYPSSETLTNILTYQEEDLKKLVVEIENDKSVESRKEEFSNRTRKKKEKLAKRQIFQNNLDILGNTYFDTLTQLQADALYSINNELAALPVDLPISTQAAMDSLSKETKILNNTVFIGETPLPNIPVTKYDGNVRQEELFLEIKKIDEWIFDNDRRLEELRITLKDETVNATLIATKEKALRAAESELSYLRNLEAYKEQYESAENELKQYTEEIAALELESEISEVDLETSRQKLEKINTIINHSASKVDFLTNADSQLETTVLSLDILLDDKCPELLSGVFDHQQLRAITDMANKEQNNWTAIIGQLRDFLIATSEEEGFSSVQLQENLANTIESKRVLYSQLPERKSMLSASILSHKAELENQLQELYEAKKTVQLFVDSLNSTIAEYSISNLDSFLVNVEFDPRFTQLMNSLDQYNLNDTNLIDEGFYTRLTSFCDNFFKTKTRNIDLEKMITKVTYSYRLQGKKDFETKAQSGGTNSTITALVLATLLKEISPNFTRVRFPIVVDEIGTQSGNNIASTYNAMEGLDFTLLCATPEPIPSIIDLIGRHVSIGKINIQKPLVADCHSLILNSLSERFGRLTDV